MHQIRLGANPRKITSGVLTGNGKADEVTKRSKHAKCTKNFYFLHLLKNKEMN